MEGFGGWKRLPCYDKNVIQRLALVKNMLPDNGCVSHSSLSSVRILSINLLTTVPVPLTSVHDHVAQSTLMFLHGHQHPDPVQSRKLLFSNGLRLLKALPMSLGDDYMMPFKSGSSFKSSPSQDCDGNKVL